MTDNDEKGYSPGAELMYRYYGSKAEPCNHDWQKTSNWLIDRCSKCGEERA